MNWLREYTIQVVFVAIQAVVIVYGVLAVSTMLKVAGYPEDSGFSLEIRFVRHAGFLLFFIPGAWVWLTIWYENEGWNYPAAFSILSGAGVAACLFLYLNFMAMNAHRMRDYSNRAESCFPALPESFAGQGGNNENELIASC